MIKSLIIAALTAGSLVSAISCSDKTINVESDGDAKALQDCSSIKGNVKLGPGVFEVDLSGIGSIGGDLTCEKCTNATSITAPDLETIGGTLMLTSMIQLSRLEMAKLVSVGGIKFVTLPNLPSMTFGPISKADNVEITDTILSDLSAIDLDSCDRFDVNNNRYLKDITMGIQSVNELFTVTFNAKSVRVSLPNLVESNNLTFRDVGKLEMPKLKLVNSSLSMINCTFDSVSFPNLTTVGQSLAIVSDDSLTEADFPKLTRVGGGLQISNNTALASVDGFGSLKSVGGAIDFNGAMKTVKIPKVNDVRGGFNLQTTAKGFDCAPFQKLKDDGEIQGTYTCKSGLDESQVGGLGEDKGGGSGSDKKNGAGNVAVGSVALIASTLFSLLYVL